MGNIRKNKENGGVVLSPEEQARLDEISKQYTQNQADAMFESAKQGKSSKGQNEEQNDELMQLVNNGKSLEKQKEELLAIVKEKGKSIGEQERALLEVAIREAREEAIKYYESKNFSVEEIKQMSTDYETDDQEILTKRQEFEELEKKLQVLILRKKQQIFQRAIEESTLGKCYRLINNLLWAKGMVHVKPLNTTANQQKEVDKMLEEYEKKNAQKENGEVR